MKYMMDTNICIYIIKRKPMEVFARFQEHEYSEICISSITLAELSYGVEKSSNISQNKFALHCFLAPVDILQFTDRAAIEYGKIRASLERRGEVIGAYDMLIAAHAYSEGITLVTNNTSEFSRISGLNIENWTIQ
jgi:Predicted nucleic acid-binding protein, contains PIN domain